MDSVQDSAAQAASDLLAGLWRRGEIVPTGTCVVPVPIAPGDRGVGDYGALGQIAAAFTA